MSFRYIKPNVKTSPLMPISLVWWKGYMADLPAWAAACKKLLLVQPSSAAAERVFSLLQNSFKKSQELALEDNNYRVISYAPV